MNLNFDLLENRYGSYMSDGAIFPPNSKFLRADIMDFWTRTGLQSLLHVCEIELNWLDMSINEKKSYCIRIGPRSDLKCASITTSNGHNLPWVNEVRLPGHIILSPIGTLNALYLKQKSPFIVPLIPSLEKSVE